ncbi:MAG: response regulator [Bacteriovoracaceae bacterium]|nr:response regulator [Bacteriovoracaceae bacterium]
MVLVVDDENDIGDFIQEILWLNDIPAQACSDSEKALELISTGRYSCLITDIAMPKLNGIELSKLAKELFPNIKIICVSSYSEMMKEDLASVKIDHYFPKPFSTNELVECVKARPRKEAVISL